MWSKDRKKKFLYGPLIKAVYGTLLRAIIFYNKPSKHLIDHSFMQNKYNMCTLNEIVNDEQITIQLHVNGLKVSHKNQAVLEDFLNDLKREFGQEDKLMEVKILVHKYLESFIHNV